MEILPRAGLACPKGAPWPCTRLAIPQTSPTAERDDALAKRNDKVAVVGEDGEGLDRFGHQPS
jgi:hypothetical protein